MSLLARVGIALSLLLIVISGCSTPTPTPATSPACVAESCNGKDPTAIKCEEGALSITGREGDYINIGELEGALEIRKALPSVCNGMYWARFTPALKNTGAFELTFEVNGKRTEPQLSEPQSPSTTAWSAALFANKGDMLRACVREAATKKEECTDPLKVV